MRIEPSRNVNTNIRIENMAASVKAGKTPSAKAKAIAQDLPSAENGHPKSVGELIDYARSHDGASPSVHDPLVKLAKKIGVVECSTCANRKYQDGSNDTGVSFKNAAHISPDNAFAVVSSHEQEHVQEAKSRTSQKGGKLISASIRIFVSTCPECGRTYVSGGETRTVESYSKDQFNKNDPSTAFYNTNNAFDKNEGALFDSIV